MYRYVNSARNRNKSQAFDNLNIVSYDKYKRKPQ